MKRYGFIGAMFVVIAGLAVLAIVLGVKLDDRNDDLVQSKANVTRLQRDQTALEGLLVMIAYETGLRSIWYGTVINKGVVYAAIQEPGSMEVATDGVRAAVRVRDLTTRTREIGKPPRPYEVKMTSTIRFPLETPHEWISLGADSWSDWPLTLD